jgi:hypothetical protein
MRIGIWVRRNAKGLVDTELWQKIQDKFPERVALRRQGLEMEEEDLDELFPCVPTHQHVEQGEIGKEFRKEMSDFQREEEHRNTKSDLVEEAGSQELPEGIDVTEEDLAEQKEAILKFEQEKKDAELARTLENEQNLANTSSPVAMSSNVVRASLKRPSPSRCDKGGGKRLKQLSLKESFQKKLS